MPESKKVVVRHGDQRRDHDGESVEQALKNIAELAKKGELEFPFVLEFDGPGGAKYNIAIDSPDAVHEVSRQGFMF